MEESMAGYPASLSIDYPDQSDRLTTFFRLFTALPILVLLALLTNAQVYGGAAGDSVRYFSTAGLVVVPTVLMIVVRRKYPKWWFDWNLSLTKFTARVLAYLLLLRDEYPSTDEEQAVHIEIPYPDAATELNQWLPLVKWFLALPHAIVLSLLWVAAVFCSMIAWFAIMLTGRYPRELFDFVVGVMRWSLRVDAYALLLTTDRYPPFSLAA